ncbi:putative Fe-S cluster assembly protein SufT [Abyssibacter profundi]|uniref:Putative Fe-S cluster assembly protein SufT n=1 Tax=Abyssibacter profundi TaxID=2182787 RepID=A0A363UKK8_9GAMM|nr:putative Fe-S cluster assembly protein SufT [Abyssibacter profundi]MBV62475.1 putative Fe-S cluster assembly protein SufT [Nevskiales bacterium]PWN55965.1 putative Fe-S cluster assembly protein SufT [Abyssibacter profundi]
MHGTTSEPVTLRRDVIGILIPAGDKVELPEDTDAVITQALGGSYTIYVEGHLFRIDGKDADALGKQPEGELTLPDNASDEDVEQLIWEQMKTCYDPEIPVNIVDLGLIYRCQIEHGEQGREVTVDMTLTAPGCGMGDILVNDVRTKVLKVPTVETAHVELVFDPPWSQNMMSEAARLATGML